MTTLYLHMGSQSGYKHVSLDNSIRSQRGKDRERCCLAEVGQQECGRWREGGREGGGEGDGGV